MSLSEPCSPSKSTELIDEKWLDVSSCVDLSNSNQNGRNDALNLSRMSAATRKKKTIECFLADHEGNLDAHVDTLRDLARSTGGLLDDGIRKRVWPVLARNIYKFVSDDVDKRSEELDELSESEANTHKEWNQVQLDVHRTLARFPPNIDEDDRNELQSQLTPLIIKVISGRRDFQYYQGLHDVFLTLLLVVGKDDAEEMGRNLVRKGVFHNYLSLSLDEGVCKQLELIYVILSRVDPHLESIFREVQLGPIFALSWPLTWFSHSLHNYSQIVRVFDVFLSSDPLLPIYFSAACILYRRNDIISCEREMPLLHHLLGTIPSKLPMDSLISDSLYLARLIPPLLLQGKYLRAYKESSPPTSTIVPIVSSLSRYAIQVVFMAGAFSAAAGYYLLSRTL